MKNLALFDFDGTVTYKDSFLEFMKFYKGSKAFWLGMLKISPWLVALKLKAIPNWKVKEKALTHFFKGEPLHVFNKKAEAFCEVVVPSLLKADAVLKIKEHQQAGDRVVLVSASAENWLKPWTEKIGIELQATRLEVVAGNITGKLVGKNCHGPEKCARINQLLNIADYNTIIAYGDTSGDTEMLALAHQPNYRLFTGSSHIKAQ